MSETPRLRSAFPATPRTDIRTRNVPSRPVGFPASKSQVVLSPKTKPIQSVTSTPNSRAGPLIPLDTVDAPTQRLYVAAFYTALLAWRLYNAFSVTDELDSTWLFLKWLAVDAAFFVALPAFQVPWLEWSFATTITIWLLHAIANAFLMYKIPIPLLGWLGAMVRVAYDRELAVAEHRVKPADVMHNSSIILGKQIIQILPEGSAILNPGKLSFCLDSTRPTAELPIQINQTSPISIELTRYDLESNQEEQIVINQKQARKLKLNADKGHARSDANTPRTLRYTISKPGLYRLTRVVDETKLDVRRRSHDVAVVPCPKATISAPVKDKCTGELSGIWLHVHGVPPLKVKYSKQINQLPASSITQTVQSSDADDYSETPADTVVDPRKPDTASIRSRKISVEISEALHATGTWSYLIEGIEDGLGNIATLHSEKARKSTHANHHEVLTVHGRPDVSLRGCDSQHPKAVAEGYTTELPVHAQILPADWPLSLTYSFIPESGTEALPMEEYTFDLSSERVLPRVSKAGRYSLQSIESKFCRGKVNEPSSCAVYHPPQPALSMESEVVADKCAGNPIGMIVSLDFIGTPPFKVHYSTLHNGARKTLTEKFNSMRGQLVFHEERAGSYEYQINSIEDAVYDAVSLKGQQLILKQDIKPPASAKFAGGGSHALKLCRGTPVTMPVEFQGEGPWDLEYELVHGGKRKKFTLRSEGRYLNIELPELNEGGRYSVILTGIQDSSNCRNALSEEERHIDIRTEQPAGAFGEIDGQRSINIREGDHVNIPVKLKGAAPWIVQVQNIDRKSSPVVYHLQQANSVIKVHEAGTYELVSVQDSPCIGVVDPKRNKFGVSWIPRPKLLITDNSLEQVNANAYRKSPVCQGYEDQLSLGFSGKAPFGLSYKQRSDVSKGQRSTSTKSLSVIGRSTAIKLETSKAGDYTYTLETLKDDIYDHDKRHFKPVTITQQVYAPPSAKFADSGKTYEYCKEDVEDSSSEVETIPLILTGAPPFSVEIAITHHGVAHRPEIKRVHDIPSNSYRWTVPRSSFELGTHNLQIRSVKDSRGCESTLDTDASSVRVHVSSPPTINPLESATDYCVGDRVSFSLSGQAPFQVYYTFQGRERKAQETGFEFKRITDAPGDFIVTGVSDVAMGGSGKCRARKEIRKSIHPYPSVRIEKGQTKISDIHEGGEVDIHFEFTGTPPFEFTFIRSENISPKSKNKNKKPAILETRHEISNDYKMVIQATEEGTYEVISIKDRYCAYSAARGASSNQNRANQGGIGWKDQKMLKDSIR